MKKFYEVELISTTIQTKLVQANSKQEAENLAENEDWMGKEEVLDTRTKVVIVPEKEVKGRYVLTSEGSKRF